VKNLFFHPKIERKLFLDYIIQKCPKTFLENRNDAQEMHRIEKVNAKTNI